MAPRFGAVKRARPPDLRFRRCGSVGTIRNQRWLQQRSRKKNMFSGERTSVHPSSGPKCSEGRQLLSWWRAAALGHTQGLRRAGWVALQSESRGLPTRPVRLLFGPALSSLNSASPLGCQTGQFCTRAPGFRASILFRSTLFVGTQHRRGNRAGCVRREASSNKNGPPPGFRERAACRLR